MFEELLRRAARSARGVSDRADLDRFRQDQKRSPAQRRWAAYLQADICRRIGRFGRAQGWLDAAFAAATADTPLLWRADAASCQADVESAFDEPQRALSWAEEAWRGHVSVGREALASREALDALLAEIDCCFLELCSAAGADTNTAELLRRASWMNDRLAHGVLNDANRLIPLAGSLGAIELARTVAADTIAWSEQLTPLLSAVVTGELPRPSTATDAGALKAMAASLAPMRALMQIEVQAKLGDAEDMCGNYENAGRLFDAAARLAAQPGALPNSATRVLQLELNSANQLAKLSRHAEAQAAYERLLPQSETLGFAKATMACRFGIVSCRWRQGAGSAVLGAQKDLAAELERMFLAAPDDEWTRAMLLSAYRLLVNIIAADPATLADHLQSLLQVLYAIRTPNAVAALAVGDEDAHRSARFGVDLLLARWSAVSDAVLLVWETGAEDMVLTTLASGNRPLAERIDVACIPNSAVKSLFDCIAATRDASEQISMRIVGLKRSGASAMEEAARKVWELLPASVQRLLDAADTIYYSPPNQSTLDELPLEALHDGRDFLGMRKVICRVPSLSHLSDLLAPNRYRQALSPHALLVRAKDPVRAQDDGTVLQQAELVAAGIDALGLQVERLDEPAADAFLNAVSAPTTLMHFVGHGFAGGGGEVLVLSETEQVPIAQVTSGSGVRAPFTYFSACEVGRGRQMSSGAQRGLAATFMDAGAPAILAPAYRIPSHFLGRIAAVFYQQCASLPAGPALQQTRRLLHAQQYHPACWATLALFGDPLACLTTEAAAACRTRPAPWCSLVFPHLATQDAQRLQACLEALAGDARLDNDLRSAIHAWLSSGLIDPEQVAPLLARLRERDGEAAATLEILHVLQEVADVNTGSPQDAQDAARDRLNRALRTASALQDSYAAICVVEAFGKVGVPMSDLGSLRQLLDHEHVLLQMLAADAAALERIATPLAALRDKLSTMTFMNVGTRFGYADEDMAEADQGSPAALRRVALAMLEAEAHPETSLGIVPWHVWLLRWGGTGTTSACRNVLAALSVDGRSGQLGAPAAAALRALVGELKFASPLDPKIVGDALAVVKRDGPEFNALRLMLLKDAVEAGGSVTLADVEAALALADELNGTTGRTGIAAWLRTVLAESYETYGDHTRAAELARQAVDELAALQEPRDEYTSRLAQAVELAIAVARSSGDAAGAVELEERCAETLAKAGTPEQEMLDEHGRLAQHLDDFRADPIG